MLIFDRVTPDFRKVCSGGLSLKTSNSIVGKPPYRNHLYLLKNTQFGPVFGKPPAKMPAIPGQITNFWLNTINNVVESNVQLKACWVVALLILLCELVAWSDSNPNLSNSKAFQITASAKAHWTFQPLTRPEVPRLNSESGDRVVSNPVDAFIDRGLLKKGLKRNPSASPRELIRRASFDLTGLPPSFEDVRAFERDPSFSGWVRLVDKYLESPAYGEKWGRHWLDLVRYAESNSYERDGTKPHAWRFRDYVVESLNSDKPYSRFVREQLAGDELEDADANALIATGFYRLGIWDDEPADRELAMYDSLDDIVATTSQVFLGLTIDCARCHHHKIDPLSQTDYYRMLSFFRNIQPYKNGGASDELTLPDGGKALGVTERKGEPPETHVLARGNPALKGEVVKPGFLEVVEKHQSPVVVRSTKSGTSGRRSNLADWIVSSKNPMTWRVLANRLWQHHFGRGIVRSPNNFGLQGDSPTHPELLDWLAYELIQSGGRLKPLHRLLMLSETYRMNSVAQPHALETDPQNDLFWRFDPRRLTAEEIRDSILWANGTLNYAMGGKSIYVEIPKAVLAGQSVPGKDWGKSDPAQQARRSIYIFAKRSLLTPLLESFDVAETDRSAPVRFVTVQPTQALGMLNSDFLNQQATLLAARLSREVGINPRAVVEKGFQLLLARLPNSEELRDGVSLIEDLRTNHRMSIQDSFGQFCLMLLNLNEVIYVD